MLSQPAPLFQCLKPTGIHLSQPASERSQGGWPRALLLNYFFMLCSVLLFKRQKEWLGKGTDKALCCHMKESHSLPYIVAHDQWCSALALVCSALGNPLRGVVRMAGWPFVLNVCLTPPTPIVAHHSVWAKDGVCCVHRVSGFLFQPRVSRVCGSLEDAPRCFMFCSCHREGNA